MILIIGILLFGYLVSSLLSGLNLAYLNSSIKKGLPPEISSLFDGSKVSQIARYTADKTKLGYWSEALSVGVVIFLFTAGIVPQITLWANALQIPRLLQGLAVMFALLLIGYLSGLPASLYSDFKLEKKYGFSTITVKTWLGDQVKNLLVTGILMGLLFSGFYLFINWLGIWWWLAAWGLVVSVTFLMIFLSPVVLMPLFNKFVPLEDGEMKSRIEALLTRCGFRSNGLFVMDGSKRSSHGNAYFTGFGNNKRIVFFDTLLARLAPPEVEAVLAHELGHFRRRHVVKRIAFMFVAALGLLWLLGQLIDAPWFYAGLGVPAQSTALALIIFFLVIPLFTFPLNPLLSRMSRQHEFEADAYAAAQTAAADLGRALVKLYEDNAATLTPDPLHSLFHDSHPPAAARLARLQAASR